MPHTVFRTCTLCEASCGLAFDVDGDRITGVRPDHDDVLSHGYVCPKGIAIAAVHDDPDRLRQPVRRQPDGSFAPIGWNEALDLVATRLRAVQHAHGKDAVAVYVGNPVVHNPGVLLLRSALLAVLGTKNSTSAGSQDTSPRFATSWHLYGSSVAIPVPDVDRTDYLLCLGANPVVSNGSFLTAPDMRGRLRAIQARGGRVVIVDPRATESAKLADEHVRIRPGGDAALLLAMVHVLVREGRVDRARIARVATGWDAVETLVERFAPTRVEPHTGIPAATIERLALELADAKSGSAYSRVGICNNAFGTVATWATDVLNLAAGRLGEVGGAMFPSPAIDVVQLMGMVGGDGHGRWTSRVRGLPETASDLPASILAEEMETPGPGQVRALLTFAGNPVLSTPNGRRLDAALAKLDFVASIDLYVNETTRHADVILPPAWSLTEDHADLLMPNFAARNVARWSPKVVPLGPGERHDWEIVLDLVKRLGGGPTGKPWQDRLVAVGEWLGWRWTPDALLSLAVRIGPRGDRFLPWSSGLTMDKLRAAPHGIDLGPLEPGIARRVQRRDGLVHLAAAPILDDARRLAATLDMLRSRDELLMIGRRDIRSNNSWMHNVPAMVSGRARCVLYVHPADAARAGVADGDTVTLASRVHRGEVAIRVTDEISAGVVSLPHGWGHAPSAAWQRTAGAHAGVSANDWSDDQLVEGVVGQSVLNGVPVTLHKRDVQDTHAA
ncbi:MAG TPA: molybdopterin-dependent oxidoreductase [Candidatus Binatia bacterium]|jgi:anaerobic selenocysteine-containing dehydrogenase|nr:molybdopterin-dependent oxidoreductase [Candidatus Binatia bacterium]